MRPRPNRKMSRLGGPAALFSSANPPAALLSSVTYADLTTELEALLRELEHDDIPLDELTLKVQRCYTLIREARQHLHAAEEAVARVIDDFGPDGASSEAGEEEDPDEEDDLSGEDA